MKKIMFIFMLAAMSLASVAQTTYVLQRTSDEPSEYRLDNRFNQVNTKQTAFAGGMTRFGYAFNYDAFTYGVSLLYHWDGPLGITIGFDGYYISKKRIVRLQPYGTDPSDTIPSNVFNMPLWDIRAGLMLGKYFMIGAMVGKTNVDDYSNLISMRENAWFKSSNDGQVLYGGFITLVLPVSKNFGFNVDFAVTNKTGFNIGAGFNITIPLK